MFQQNKVLNNLQHSLIKVNRYTHTVLISTVLDVEKN